jgi:hypothetical protein
MRQSMPFYCLNMFLALLAKPPHCNTLHDNTRAHYFAYLFQVWPPKSVSYLLIVLLSGFGGLVASMLASGIQVRGVQTQPKRKNPQHAFLRRGGKAVGPMSQICVMLENPTISWKSDCLAKFDRPFLAHNSSFR